MRIYIYISILLLYSLSITMIFINQDFSKEMMCITWLVSPRGGVRHIHFNNEQ